MASIEVFCCYAHKDAPLLESLKAHLTLLQKQGLISLWSDTNISPGSEWEKEIETINKTVVENNTTLSENACALIADQAKQLDGFWYLRNQKQSASDHLWISSMLRYLTSVHPKGYTALPILVYNKGREPESTLKINKSIFCPINFATYGQSFWQHWLTTSFHGTICAKL